MRAREHVTRFGKIMLLKLNEPRNLAKGWPVQEDMDFLFRRLMDEVLELHEAVKCGKSAGEVALEAADVACFAMFIADVAGGLDKVDLRKHLTGTSFADD